MTGCEHLPCSKVRGKDVVYESFLGLTFDNSVQADQLLRPPTQNIFLPEFGQ